MNRDGHGVRRVRRSARFASGLTIAVRRNVMLGGHASLGYIVVTEPPITNVLIEHTSIAAPAHVLSQQDVKRTLQDTLSVAPPRLKAVSTLLDGAAVERRCSVLPLDA